MKYKAIVKQEECVACGACVKVCPRRAINIYKGIYAAVDWGLCVGCGLCAGTCPASVIEKTEVNG
ncbi:4Fe-4S ferredoxin [Clostridium sp. chh4-2]|uniref:4Fe-4S binding protein n=1 Tax=Clostridium sp. chh4-2 TaxID=2067550 RepID=UPI000CCE0302|nr:4Fe-4S binding protein [Clostridium sp. chh4-2]PNV62922.1 4Fe-4S ferredoxin [Clostridium sp. chh4-2]